MKKFLLAFGIILALAFTVTAATSNFNPTHETSVSSEKDGDCDKCDKKGCKGDCTAAKKGEAKSCCKKDGSKKACTGKKECKKGEAKKACAHKEAH
jgi:hypothetical protein